MRPGDARAERYSYARADAISDARADAGAHDVQFVEIRRRPR